MATKDFVPVIEAVADSGCDLLFLSSYLAASIRLVRAIRAHPFRPKMMFSGVEDLLNTYQGRGRGAARRPGSAAESP